jgi:hypothetical protein
VVDFDCTIWIKNIGSKVNLFFVALLFCESSPVCGGQTLFDAIAMILRLKGGPD